MPHVFQSQNLLGACNGHARLYRRGPASYLLLYQTLPFIHLDQECMVQAALVTGTQVMTDAYMCVWIIQVVVRRLSSPCWIETLLLLSCGLILESQSMDLMNLRKFN